MSDPGPDAELRWVDVPIEIPAEGQVATFAVGDLALLLCNAAGTPYVLHDQCPHVRVSMAGALIRGTLLECPLHGGLMDVRDGSPQGMPIRRPGTCYAVRSEGDVLQVAVPA
ncbi:MAG: Rieske (2Fe-2S) protein [Myxococcota bacterium]